MKRAFLGELEEVVLLTVAALKESAYCALINQTMDQQMGRNIIFLTVHTTLQLLAKKRLCRFSNGRGDSRAGRSQKRLSTGTAAGREH